MTDRELIERICNRLEGIPKNELNGSEFGIFWLLKRAGYLDTKMEEDEMVILGEKLRQQPLSEGR